MSNVPDVLEGTVFGDIHVKFKPPYATSKCFCGIGFSAKDKLKRHVFGGQNRNAVCEGEEVLRSLLMRDKTIVEPQFEAQFLAPTGHEFQMIKAQLREVQEQANMLFKLQESGMAIMVAKDDQAPQSVQATSPPRQKRHPSSPPQQRQHSSSPLHQHTPPAYKEATLSTSFQEISASHPSSPHTSLSTHSPDVLSISSPSDSPSPSSDGQMSQHSVMSFAYPVKTSTPRLGERAYSATASPSPAYEHVNSTPTASPSPAYEHVNSTPTASPSPTYEHVNSTPTASPSRSSDI